MIPFLTYPLALIALASLPALAAIYILRNRLRRRQVSSLVLWRFQVQSRQGGAKIHRLQVPLLFFLELLALAFLVTAAAGPHWKLPQSTRPLVVVLDDSFSMRAVSDGESSQTRAKNYLAGLFHLQPPPSTLLIVAGLQPRSLGAPVKSWKQVEELLGQWSARSPGTRLDSALTLAAEVGGPQANLLVLTDHKPGDEKISNPRLEWHAFGSPADNCAFVNAARTALGDSDRCLLEVANYSARAHSVRLEVRAGSNSVQASTLTLAPREIQRLTFNIPAKTPALHASLEPDALADDNEIQLLPPIRRRVRVRVALANENLAELANRTLDATGLRSSLSENPELIIGENVSTAADPVTNNFGHAAWTMRWVGASGTNTFSAPFLLDNSHPLADGVSVDGSIWSGRALTNMPGDLPVIFAGNVPLLSTREGLFGRQQITLNFNPTLSTVQNTPAWPVLFWNILAWRISEMPGLREGNTRLGTAVNLKTFGAPLSVTQPDGSTQTFAKTGDQLAVETPVTGIYTVVLGSVTNQFSVNALAADESDLSTCVRGHWGVWSETTERRLAESSLVGVFALLALGLLAAHLYLVAKSRGAT
jgi:hypothetical protein